MVPMSVRGEADVPSSATSGSLGNRVSSFLVDLPVGEPSPVVRLHHVTHANVELREQGLASFRLRWLIERDALEVLPGQGADEEIVLP